MKKAALMMAILAMNSMADNKFFGLGLYTGGGGLGDGIGGDFALHGRLWVQDQNAVDIIANYNTGTKYISLAGEYKWFQYNDIQIKNGRLPWYFGAGPFVSLDGGISALGINGKGGLSWEPSGIPFDFFAEAGPSLALLKSPNLGFGIGLGFHWYLK